MKLSQKNAWIYLVFVFLAISSVFYLSSGFLEKNNINVPVVLGGNLVLFVASMITFFMHVNALKSSNNSVFFRNTYGSFMIKIVLCLVAAFAYIYSSGSSINKAAIFICMGLYFLYTFLEVFIVLRKPKTNG